MSANEIQMDSEQIFDIYVPETEDATIPAQKILSAIWRTKESFGEKYLCDLVLGNKTKRIEERGDDQLRTFGCGKDKPLGYWLCCIKPLIEQKIVRIEPGPILKLTDAAREILFKDRKFQMPKAHPSLLRKTEAGQIPLKSVEGLSPFAVRLYHAMLLFRKDLFRWDPKRHCVLFAEHELLEIARCLPLDRVSLLRIQGCGPKKYEAYGEAFLNIIRRFCDESPEEANASRLPLPKTDIQSKQDLGMGNSTYVDTLKRLQQGQSVKKIAQDRNLSPETVFSHIAKLMKWGHEFSPDQFFTPERFAQIREWFRMANDDDIASVVFVSRGQLGYGEAKLASLFINKDEQIE